MAQPLRPSAQQKPASKTGKSVSGWKEWTALALYASGVRVRGTADPSRDFNIQSIKL